MKKLINRKNRKKATVRNCRGESMLMVIVLLMVFLTLGVAVLTAASATTATASARNLDRQLYYYARSSLDALDEEMRKGKLGETLNQYLLEQLKAVAEQPVPQTSLTKDVVIQPVQLTLNSDNIEGVTFADGKITFTGRADALTISPNRILQEAYVRMQNVKISYTVQYKGLSYAMSVTYRFNGWARLQANGDWGWSGTWQVQQVG